MSVLLLKTCNLQKSGKQGQAPKIHGKGINFPIKKQTIERAMMRQILRILEKLPKRDIIFFLFPNIFLA